MKKCILSVICFLLLLSQAAGAATKQKSINLAPFSSISVSGPFTVSLVRGSDYRALVSIEEAYEDYLICNTASGGLQISVDEKRVPSEIKRQFRGKGTPSPVFSAVVYVPELIKSVTVSDKAVLENCEDVFDKARAAFTLTGNANVKQLSLSSQVFELNMQNKSEADFTVICKNTIVGTSNSASLKIDDTSEQSEYSLQGSSKVNAKSRTTSVRVRTKANSSMKLSGSGENAAYELSGTSEVDASEFEVPDATVSMSSVCLLSQSAYKSLTVNLNGGSTLYFANDPQIYIENIKSSTVSRSSTSKSKTRL